MPRWEYKVVSLRDRQYTAALNEFGLDGWELVSVISEAVEPPSPERSSAIPLPRVLGRLEEAAGKLNKLGGADPAVRLGARWQERSDRGFGVDTAYAAVGRGVVSVARVVVTLDRDVVDAYPRGAGAVAGLLGRAGERAHRGVPSTGLVALVVGFVALAVAGVMVWL